MTCRDVRIHIKSQDIPRRNNGYLQCPRQNEQQHVCARVNFCCGILCLQSFSIVQPGLFAISSKVRQEIQNFSRF